MAAKSEAGDLERKERARAEILETIRDLHEADYVSDGEMELMKLRVLGPRAMPKLARLSAEEITELRERAGVSAAILAGF